MLIFHLCFDETDVTRRGYTYNSTWFWYNYNYAMWIWYSYSNYNYNRGCGVGGKIADSNSDLSKISDSRLRLPKISDSDSHSGDFKISDSDSRLWLLNINEWNLTVEINGSRGAQQEICFNKSFERNCTISTGIPNLGVWCKNWSNWTSGVGVGQENQEKCC